MDDATNMTRDRVPTIVDVAQLAGVGLGTVSRVLNGHSSVSATTRARVRTAIAQLGYLPSPAARALPRRRSDTVGVVVPFFTHPSAQERLRGVVSRLATSPFHLVLFNAERPDERASFYGDVLGRFRTDGLLAITLTPSLADARRLQAAAVPVVIVDGRCGDLPSVRGDDRSGGALAARWLLELGHRHIAYVGDDPNPEFGFVSAAERKAGFADTLAAAGVPLAPELVREADSSHGRAEARRMAMELLRRAEPPTAVFGYSDTQALGVLDAARELGVAVPSELTVIGFDDLEVATHVGLSTVRQPLFESGRIGADLLLDLLDGQPLEQRHVELAYEAVARATTAPPRGRPRRQ